MSETETTKRLSIITNVMAPALVSEMRRSSSVPAVVLQAPLDGVGGKAREIIASAPQNGEELAEFAGWVKGQAGDFFRRAAEAVSETVNPSLLNKIQPALKHWGVRQDEVWSADRMASLRGGYDVVRYTVCKDKALPAEFVTVSPPRIRLPYNETAYLVAVYDPPELYSTYGYDPRKEAQRFLAAYRANSGLGILGGLFRDTYTLEPYGNVPDSRTREAEQQALEALYSAMPYARPRIVQRGRMNVQDKWELPYIDVEAEPGWKLPFALPVSLDPRVIIGGDTFPWGHPLQPIYDGYQRILGNLARQQSERASGGRLRVASSRDFADSIRKLTSVSDPRSPFRGMMDKGIPVALAGPMFDSLTYTVSQTARPAIEMELARRHDDYGNTLLSHSNFSSYQ